MKRSSSKLITRARSVVQMGKVPFKFKFNLTIETVDRIASSGDVVFVLERNNKTDATKATRIDPSTRKANFGNAVIPFDIVLYKNQPSEKTFLERVLKLALKSGRAEGKTLGKIHLNFAEYAEVPSGTKKISAELTNGATLIAKIESTFISMGKTNGKPPKADAAMEEGGDDLGAEAEDISKDADSDHPSGFMKSKFTQKLGRAVSKTAIGRERKNRDDDSGAKDTVEKLRKENSRLRRQIEDMEKASPQTFAPGSDAAKLQEENRALKSEVNDLRMALAREPVYSDIVRELKETKMALALLNLEKEEYQLELMNCHRKMAMSPVST